MSWLNTLDARSRGDVEGFHSHDATREAIEAAEAAAAKAEHPDTAHAGPVTVDNSVADDDDETATKTVKATKKA